jgi:hypothetical protein
VSSTIQATTGPCLRGLIRNGALRGGWLIGWLLRQFLHIGLDENTPDHSTISRTRRLIDVETHRKVFGWVLGLLADRGLLKGKIVGIDGTTLEANAAMRSIVRRDNGQRYKAFLTELAQKSGIATPSREDLARIDRKRKKKGSNQEWPSKTDPDAHHQDEGWFHAHGPQGRACGGHANGSGDGSDVTGRRSRRYRDGARNAAGTEKPGPGRIRGINLVADRSPAARKGAGKPSAEFTPTESRS